MADVPSELPEHSAEGASRGLGAAAGDHGNVEEGTGRAPAGREDDGASSDGDAYSDDAEEASDAGSAGRHAGQDARGREEVGPSAEPGGHVRASNAVERAGGDSGLEEDGAVTQRQAEGVADGAQEHSRSGDDTEPLRGDANEGATHNSGAEESPDVARGAGAPRRGGAAASPEARRGKTSPPPGPEDELSDLLDSMGVSRELAGRLGDRLREYAEMDRTALLRAVLQLEGVMGELEERVQVEEDTRRELEDMLVRLEKHLQAEEAARHSAEARERDLETSVIERDRATAKNDDLMREMEAELEAARVDARRAEERLTQAVEVARAHVAASWQVRFAEMQANLMTQVHAIQAENERLARELQFRGELMGKEIAQWKAHAEQSSRAVLEARDEVIARRRELDKTNAHLNRMMESLAMGSDVMHLDAKKGNKAGPTVANKARKPAKPSTFLTSGRGGLPALPSPARAQPKQGNAAAQKRQRPAGAAGTDSATAVQDWNGAAMFPPVRGAHGDPTGQFRQMQGMAQAWPGYGGQGQPSFRPDMAQQQFQQQQQQQMMQQQMMQQQMLQQQMQQQLMAGGQNAASQGMPQRGYWNTSGSGFTNGAYAPTGYSSPSFAEQSPKAAAPPEPKPVARKKAKPLPKVRDRFEEGAAQDRMLSYGR
ncbi:unnamed protein product [Pedinophyceae sp. YPF-701]|nr:unnamed protein product [Pedinophyceae sp. YPF-701]